MKKIINILLFAAITFTFFACDYNERNFEGYEDKSQVKNLVSYEHEISTTDITTIVNALRAKKTKEDSTTATDLNNAKAFSSKLYSQDLIPYLLKATYRAVDNGSTVKVTFPFVSDDVVKLSGAGSYVVSAADYETVWDADNTTAFFTPGNAPAEKLPTILSAAFPAAADGDIKVVRYNYSENEPAGFVSGTMLSEDFESNYAAYDTIKANGWTHYKESGTYAWSARSYSNNMYAQMSNNSSSTAVINKAWMISPKIDLSQTTNNKFSFDVCVGYWKANCLEIKITTDAALNTNPTSNNWTDVTAQFTLPTTPTSGFGTSGTAGSMNLSAYTGSIFIAFRYDGDGSTTPQKTTTYQIDNILVEGASTTAGGGGPQPNPQPNNAIYAYNGTAWAPSSTAIALNPADYDAMGVTSLTAATAPNYLPTFLTAKFPYTQEGNTKAVVYGSKTGNPGGLATEYQYKAGAWAAIRQTEQYVLSPQGWVFDPAVYYTMTTADHKMMVDYMKDTHPEFVVADYENEEFYYGFSNRYTNLSFRILYRALYAGYDDELTDAGTDEEKLSILFERSKEGMRIFCEKKFPDAIQFVSGAQVFYKITVKVHSPNDGITVETIDYEYTFKCLGNGAFEFVEYKPKA
jgi:hypothetical protein